MKPVVDAQSFQMYVDPGTPGYFGGMMNNYGVPRATFHAFTLFAMLKGRQVRVNSSDPWVKSVAFVDGSTVYLLISSAVPTSVMLRNTVPILQALRNGAFTKSVVRDGLVPSLITGEALPPAMAAQVRAIEAQGERVRREDAERADVRRAGPPLQLVISGLGLPKNVVRYLIDATHANIYPRLDSATRILEAEKPLISALPARLNLELRNAGLTARTAESVNRVLGAGASLDRALAGVTSEERVIAHRVVETAVGQLLSQHARSLRTIESWPGAGLRADTVTFSDMRPLRLTIEPNSVVLYIMRR